MSHRGFPLSEMYRRGMVPPGAGIAVSFNYLDFYTLAGHGVALEETLDESPNEFPLVVTAVPGAVQASVHTGVLSEARAASLLAAVEDTLRAMVGDPEAPARPAGVAGWTDDPLPPDAPEPVDVAGGPAPPALLIPGISGAADLAELRRVGALVAGAWAAVLPVPVDDLDGTSDFLALGGHSLDAMRIAALPA